MKPTTIYLSALLLLMINPFTMRADGPKVRPGKGMDLIPGDFAEYSNTEYFEGKATELSSTIMVSMGSQGEFQGVTVLFVKGDELTSAQNVLYDLSKERVKTGKLIDRGTGSINISGQSYDCVWEKRGNEDTTATFWTSPALPFEQYAKVEIEFKNGRKRTTKLVYFGPDTTESEKSRVFQKRLQKFIAQAANIKQ